MSTRTRRRPAPAPCAPVGSLAEPEVCRCVRDCQCGASLHLSGVPDSGVHCWTWKDEGGQPGTITYPWGTGPEPEGYWETLAQVDIAQYSLQRSYAGMHMLGRHHRHKPAWSCVEHDRPAPEAVPTCCGMPMWQVVEGWRCREQRVLFPYVVDMEPAA